MQTIRKSVFETNSSSVHSLTVKKNDMVLKPYKMDLNYENKLVLEFGEYGWGYDTLTTVFDKLCYLLTMVGETELRNMSHEITSPHDVLKNSSGFILLENFVTQWIVDCAGIEINGLQMTIQEYRYNDSLIKYIDLTDGYIDHQSVEDYSSLEDFLYQNDTSVENLVLNDNVSIIIDNDNH